MMDRLTFTAAVLLATALPAATASAQRGREQYRARIDTTITFDASGTVTLTSGDGDIIVTGVSGRDVRVVATSEDDNLRLDATRSRIALDLASGRRGSDARFEVSVPYGVRVITRTISGDITVRGTRGEVEAHSQNGDVRIDGVTGRLDVATLSGDVTASSIAGDVDLASTSGGFKVDDVRGDIEIGTVSGDVEMRGVVSKMVRAKTTSGDVIYGGTIDPTGRYELVTHSGDVRLDIPRATNAELTVSTWSGTIDSDFPITLQPGQHGIGAWNAKRFTFNIGAGAARISAETFSGDVTVSSREPSRGRP